MDSKKFNQLVEKWLFCAKITVSSGCSFSQVIEHLQLLEWNLTPIQNILELSCKEANTYGSIIIIYMISWIIHTLWLVLISKYGKFIHGTLHCASCATSLFFAQFDMNYEVLLNRHTTTHTIYLEKGITIQLTIEYAKIIKKF